MSNLARFAKIKGSFGGPFYKESFSPRKGSYPGEKDRAIARLFPVIAWFALLFALRDWLLKID